MTKSEKLWKRDGILGVIVLLQTLITLANSVIFVWRIPWDKLTELKGRQNNPNNTGLENPNNTGLENPVAATDDN